MTLKTPAQGFDLDAEIDRRLSSTGQRWTSGRRSVVQAMKQTVAPLSITELQTLVGPAVPLSSLYRIITDLVTARIVIKLEFAEGFARFELDEELAAHHHHLVCNICGAVADLDLGELEATLDGTAAKIKRSSGFVVASHRLDFFGSCKACHGAKTR
jgi:Fur family transcriptional regulator, ferric uptake regulator